MLKWYGCFFLLVLVCSCITKKKRNESTDFIPKNASLVFKINALETLNSNLNNNFFISEITQQKAFSSFTKNLKILSHFTAAKSSYFCVETQHPDRLNFTFIAPVAQQDSIKTDTIASAVLKTEIFQNKKIKVLKIENDTLYQHQTSTISIISNSIKALQNTLTQNQTNTNAITFLQTANKESSFSVYTNTYQNELLSNFFITDSISFNAITDYTVVDTDIFPKEIRINGVTKTADSSTKVLSIFKNMIPQENTIASLTPNNADGFFSFTFNDFPIFYQQLKAIQKQNDTTLDTSLLTFCNEIGVTYQGKNKTVIVHSFDTSATHEALLNEQNKVEIFRQVPIFHFSNANYFKTIFAPLITFSEANFYCILDNYIVFGTTKETLENTISSYQNHTTFTNSYFYTNLEKSLVNASSLLLVNKPKRMQKMLPINLDKIQPNSALAVQFVYDTNFAHIHASMQENQKQPSKNKVQEILNFATEVPIVSEIQIVPSNASTSNLILAQDIKHVLYCVSTSGRLLWKKQLNTAIVGSITPIDSYKNGKIQLAFATKNKLYVLDSNGKNVGRFPKNFKDTITQPLAVFDYDKTKNYRFLVTQNNKVYMYDAKGNTVSGFTFKNTKEPINSTPQHLRIGSKDYIVIKTNTKLYILNRRGKTRVSVKQNHTYSAAKVYEYQNGFLTSNQAGNIIQIDTKGNSTSSKTTLENPNFFASNAKFLVTLNENILRIKDKKIELDFGTYTAPKLFYLNRKYYISITDLQTQKVYIYTSNAELLPNFPIYGNSAVDLNYNTKDKNLELVTQGETNSFIVYKLL